MAWLVFAASQLRKHVLAEAAFLIKDYLHRRHLINASLPGQMTPKRFPCSWLGETNDLLKTSSNYPNNNLHPKGIRWYDNWCFYTMNLCRFIITTRWGYFETGVAQGLCLAWHRGADQRADKSYMCIQASQASVLGSHLILRLHCNCTAGSSKVIRPLEKKTFWQ